MNDIEFQKFLYLSSVPLVQLDEKLSPIATASGCLIDYVGKRVLLTVSHATRNQGNWTIPLRYIPGNGIDTYQLGSMYFLAEGSLLNPNLKDIDFSYVVVSSDLCAYRQEIEMSSGVRTVKSEKAIKIHSPNLKEIPNSEDKYGFCGIIMSEVEIHPGQIILDGKPYIYPGLSFRRTEDDYHFFALPFSHLGHEYFEGCSGAPIFSSSGSLVALVCGGCKKTNEICGISISALKIQIDILVGNI
jgi:hypothetical protein